MKRRVGSFFVTMLGVFCMVALLTGPIGCASSKCCGKGSRAASQTASKCKGGCDKADCKKAGCKKVSAKCKPGCTKPCCKKA